MGSNVSFNTQQTRTDALRQLGTGTKDLRKLAEAKDYNGHRVSLQSSPEPQIASAVKEMGKAQALQSDVKITAAKGEDLPAAGLKTSSQVDTVAKETMPSIPDRSTKPKLKNPPLPNRATKPSFRQPAAQRGAAPVAQRVTQLMTETISLEMPTAEATSSKLEMTARILVGDRPAVAKINRVAQEQIAKGGVGSIHTTETVEGPALIEKRPLAKAGEEGIEDLKRECSMSQYLATDNSGNNVDYVVVSHQIEFNGGVSALMERAEGDLTNTFSAGIYLDNEPRAQEALNQFTQMLEIWNSDSPLPEKVQALDRAVNEILNTPPENRLEIDKPVDIYKAARGMRNKINNLQKNLSKEGANPVQLANSEDAKLLTKDLNGTIRGVEVNGQITGSRGLTEMIGKIENLKSAGVREASIGEKNAMAGRLIDCYAHIWDKGVCHVDGKPGNLLMAGGQIKVADFGGSVRTNTMTVHNCNEVTATARYTSENGEDRIYDAKASFENGNLSERAANAIIQSTFKKQEVYTVGVMLYELYTGGRNAYDAESRQKFRGNFNRQQLVDKGVPPNMINLIEQMVSLDPSKRPSPLDIRQLAHNALGG